MKNIIVFMASPRIGGNTDLLTDKVIEGIQSHEVAKEGAIEKVYLVEYQGHVCTACGQCRPTGNCEQYDAVNNLLQKIKKADGIVLGSPTWWMAPSSQMKIFTDHWGAFLSPDYSSRIAGKKAVVVSCNGHPEISFSEQVCKGISDMLMFLQVEVKGSLWVNGVMEAGAVSVKKDILEAAYKLGRRLYQEEQQ